MYYEIQSLYEIKSQGRNIHSTKHEFIILIWSFTQLHRPIKLQTWGTAALYGIKHLYKLYQNNLKVNGIILILLNRISVTQNHKVAALRLHNDKLKFNP